MHISPFFPCMATNMCFASCTWSLPSDYCVLSLYIHIYIYIFQCCSLVCMYIALYVSTCINILSRSLLVTLHCTFYIVLHNYDHAANNYCEIIIHFKTSHVLSTGQCMPSLLKLILCRTCMHVCVCPSPRLLIIVAWYSMICTRGGRYCVMIDWEKILRYYCISK